MSHRVCFILIPVSSQGIFAFNSRSFGVMVNTPLSRCRATSFFAPNTSIAWQLHHFNLLPSLQNSAAETSDVLQPLIKTIIPPHPQICQLPDISTSQSLQFIRHGNSHGFPINKTDFAVLLGLYIPEKKKRVPVWHSFFPKNPL